MKKVKKNAGEKSEILDYFCNFEKDVLHKKLPKPSPAFFKACSLGLT